MNKVERQAAKHSTAVNGFSLSTHSQIVNGYVAGGERKATDKVFCFVFIAFILGMIGISIYGFANGDYKALIAGVDADGNICGHTSKVMDMDKTYFMWNNGALKAVCVSECPDSDDL